MFMNAYYLFFPDCYVWFDLLLLQINYVKVET